MDYAVKLHTKKLVVSTLVRKDFCPITFYTWLRMSAVSSIIQLPLFFQMTVPPPHFHCPSCLGQNYAQKLLEREEWKSGLG